MTELEKVVAEDKFAEAMSCLLDALLVSREREFFGVAHLVDSAISALKHVGRLAEINGQKRIEGDVIEGGAE